MTLRDLQDPTPTTAHGGPTRALESTIPPSPESQASPSPRGPLAGGEEFVDGVAEAVAAAWRAGFIRGHTGPDGERPEDRADYPVLCNWADAGARGYVEMNRDTLRAARLSRGLVSWTPADTADLRASLATPTPDSGADCGAGAKGSEGGACARGACPNAGARWWNTSTRRWYCDDCARAIMAHAENRNLLVTRVSLPTPAPAARAGCRHAWWDLLGGTAHVDRWALQCINCGETRGGLMRATTPAPAASAPAGGALGDVLRRAAEQCEDGCRDSAYKHRHAQLAADAATLRALADALAAVPGHVLLDAANLSVHTAHQLGDDWRSLAALLRRLAGEGAP